MSMSTREWMEFERLAAEFHRVVADDEQSGEPYLSRDAAGKCLKILERILELWEEHPAESWGTRRVDGT